MRRIKWTAGGVALLAVLGLTLAFCRSNDRPIGPGDGGEPVKAELLAFYQSGGAGLPRMATVLRSPADARAVSAWFASSSSGRPRFEVDAEKRDFRREAVLVFSFGSGCTSADGARLLAEGPNLGVRLTGTTTSQECYAPFGNLVVFALDKTKVPADVTLSGARLGRPDDPSPARLLAFAELPRPPRARAAEVTQPDQLDDFLKRLPVAATALDIEDRRDAADRRFAFVLRTCRTRSAFLRITGDRLTAEPTDENPAECAADTHYLAVFELEARYVPPTARIG